MQLVPEAGLYKKKNPQHIEGFHNMLRESGANFSLPPRSQGTCTAGWNLHAEVRTCQTADHAFVEKRVCRFGGQNAIVTPQFTSWCGTDTEDTTSPKRRCVSVFLFIMPSS